MGPGINLATTKDGGIYNKLQRPEDYLMPATAPPPPLPPKNTPLADTAYTSKRKLEHANLSTTRKRTKVGAASKEQCRDVDCGMKTTLPGLDDERYSSDEGTSEALAYLWDVRSEALAIPHLLLARTARNDSPRDHDPHVVYSDGIYIAVDGHDALSASGSTEEEASFPDPQDRQCQLLLKRFENLRTTLAAMANEQHVIANEELEDMARPLRSRRGWLDILDSEYPRLDLVMQLEERSVHRGLESCAAYIDMAASVSPQASTWMWALLASVADVRSCDNESRIRDLGQKAGLLGVRLWKEARDNRTVGGEEHMRIDQNSEPEASEPCVKPATSMESGGELVASTYEGQSQHGVELDGLEQARARLLSQLGDRLIQPQLPIQETPPGTGETKHSHAMTGDTTVWADDRESINSPSHSTSGSDAMSESSECTPSVLRQEQEPQDGGEQNSDTDAECEGSERCDIDFNTRVTIDMIVTIAAECFGQRDLLQYRTKW